MKTAILKIPSSGEKLRFEVHSTPSRGHHSGVQKWYLKANHPVEAARWTQAIGKSIEWYKKEGDGDQSRKSGESDSSALRHPPSMTRASLHEPGHGTSTRKRRGIGGSEGGSVTDSYADLGDAGPGEDASPNLNESADEGKAEEADDEQEDEDDVSRQSSEADSTRRTPPYESSFELHGNSTAAQMELTSQLLTNLSLPPNSPPRTHELKNALKDSFSMVQGMFNEYAQMAREREEWWKKQLQRERARQGLWEESLATVVKEGEMLEKELRMRSRKRGSRFFDSSFSTIGDGTGTVRQRPSTLGVSKGASIAEESTPTKTGLPVQEYFPPFSPTLKADDTAQKTPTASVPVTMTQKQAMASVASPLAMTFDDGEEIDTDEEDEFFDAIEANTLPNIIVNESIVSPNHSQMSLPADFNVEPYEAYKHLRSRLPIGSDNRPSTSLWSVLKHSIGKDLTKISFPVFFNEPTSMLQRMVSS